MKDLITELRALFENPVVEAAFNDAVAHVEPYVSEYGMHQENPWALASPEDFVHYFETWFTFLPPPPNPKLKGGLGYIVPFTFFYLNNPQALYFINEFQSKSGQATGFTKEIFNWTVKFVMERGNFMDSPESSLYIKDWIKWLGPKINDYIVPEGGYKNFNEYFHRALNYKNNPRPISHPDNPAILVASSDTELNFIQSKLTLKTSIPVKSTEINVEDLLDGSKYAEKFVGGTAISAVLLPSTYHRFHSPVGGMLVEGKDVPGLYNGVMDGDHWINSGNLGEGTTNFSIFEDFHRAYFIIETEEYGCVALIPVGLNTISTIHPSVVGNKSSYVEPGGTPIPVAKGQELGHFAYGGSLNILLFEPGVLSGISVLQGQRMGLMSKAKK